jgi:hypothetical protein
MRPALPLVAALLLVAVNAASASDVVTLDMLLHDGGGYETPYHIAPSEFNATEADLLVLTVVNPSGNQQGHDFVVERHRDAKTALLQPGKSETLRFTAGNAGNYTYYCTVPGHREAGMAGTLTIAPDPNPAGDRSDDAGPAKKPIPEGLMPALLIGILVVAGIGRFQRAR